MVAAPLRDTLATLRAALQARSHFDPAQDRRHFTLFLTDLGEAFFLPRLLARLRHSAPGVSLTTLPMPEHHPQAALEHGEVDLDIGNLPDMPPGFYQQRLFREHYVGITRSDFSGAARHRHQHRPDGPGAAQRRAHAGRQSHPGPAAITHRRARVHRA